MSRPTRPYEHPLPVLAATLALGLLAAACAQPSTPSPTTTTPPAPSVKPGVAGSSTPSIGSSPAPSASAASAASPTPDASSPDVRSVSVSLAPYATVPGGPLAIVAPRDGSGRLFVAAQDGRAWVVKDGKTTGAPLLDISSKVSRGGEQGLLGIAPHPRFPADPRVFVDYTDVAGNSVISSFTVDPSNADRLDPGSEKVILHVDQPFANHNGGAVVFGPDGYLYISFGDGGSGGDPQGNGQRRSTYLGKILRIDIDHADAGKAYAIPSDNPFVGQGTAKGEIWLYGLRNPWRMSFDRATGDLWIGDVGQDAWEEVDVIRAGQKGLNLGWNRFEATHCYEPATGCRPEGITQPVAEYSHTDGCTVIGGYVYRGSAQALLTGVYLYVDYCSGRVWGLPWTVSQLAPAERVGTFKASTVAFGEDEAGELYVASQDGTISKVVASRR